MVLVSEFISSWTVLSSYVFVSSLSSIISPLILLYLLTYLLSWFIHFVTKHMYDRKTDRRTDRQTKLRLRYCASIKGKVISATVGLVYINLQPDHDLSSSTCFGQFQKFGKMWVGAPSSPATRNEKNFCTKSEFLFIATCTSDLIS